ncbi:MAG: bifunctional hydroxymethylpyrimidine kinase/phosphomethylpyrimidine kinase [Acidobacteriota bacterium]
MTIAGSDSGGGAGIQADLKTFAAHGVYGMSVITAITAQNTRAVTAVHEVPAEVVAAQIDAVFADLGVDAVKIGMRASVPLVSTVAERLAAWLEETAVPVVLDPVMVAKSGDALLRDDAVAALIEQLLPLATVVTPNLPEARRLTGVDGEDQESRRAMARALSARGPAALIKGGHGAGDDLQDLLFDGREFRPFEHRRIATRSDHGTGCTLSSALAARLGRGESLVTAVRGSIDYLRGALAAAYPLGAGRGPVDHLFDLS